MPCPRPYFQYFLAHVRTDDIRHPLCKARCAIQTAEDLASMNILGVNVVGIAKPENRGNGPDTVLPVDLCSFLIRAACIPDRNFKNARSAPGQLEGNFRLEFKASADPG